MRKLTRSALIAAILAAAPLTAHAGIVVSTPDDTISQSIGASVSGPGSFSSPNFSSLNLASLTSPSSPPSSMPANGSAALLINQNGTDGLGAADPNRINNTQSNIQDYTNADPGGFSFSTSASSVAEADFDLLAGQTGAANVKVTSHISKTVEFTTSARQSFNLNATFNLDPASTGTSDMTITVNFLNTFLGSLSADSASGTTGLSTGTMSLPPGTEVQIITTIDTSAFLDINETGPDPSQFLQQSKASIDVWGTIPEPATLGLVALPALALLAARRRRNRI